MNELQGKLYAYRNGSYESALEADKVNAVYVISENDGGRTDMIRDYIKSENTAYALGFSGDLNYFYYDETGQLIEFETLRVGCVVEFFDYDGDYQRGTVCDLYPFSNEFNTEEHSVSDLFSTFSITDILS